MGGSDTPPASAQRTKTKVPDLSELFRSTHGSRHSSRTGAGTRSSPSPGPSPGGKSAGTKAPSRRSMLPFLGRKKLEQSAFPIMPVPGKSVGNAASSVTPVNTVRRSFGNGHAVLMITPSTKGLPSEPPLLSMLPSMDVHSPSLGSKLAAHFTPLRSSSRNNKVRYSTIQKSAPPSPSVTSFTALSPPVPEIRTPSIESQHSSMWSRSTTPRPLRRPHPSAVENGDDEDFSDLFTLPEKLQKPQQSPKSPSTASFRIHLGDTSKKSGELTPTTPITPGPSLQFPIPPLQFPRPPSTIIPPRSVLTEKGPSRYSSELASLSSQGSRSSSKRPSPLALDGGSTRSLYSDISSQDEQRNARYRTTSISGSDTDASRANDSTHSTSSSKLAPVFPRSSSGRPKLSASSARQTSSGPPPSLPLPSPPLSPRSAVLGPRSAPITSPNRVVLPRPRANTLSVTSNLVVPVSAVPQLNPSFPPRSGRANSDVTSDRTADELREALIQQRRKNAQLQEYIATITKRYEDDRTTMARTIEKLERNIRKKTREIEGLRWLVIHNGAVSDIDAAANLARSSFSTQDGHTSNGIRGLPSSPVTPQCNGSPLRQTTSRQRGASATVAMATSVPENFPDTLNSVASISTPSVSDTDLSIPSSLSTPGRTDGISRTERQKLKEERRASKALRRISAVSVLALGTDPLAQSSLTDSPLDPNFDPKQSMDEVLEKLEPFRDT